MKKLFSLLILIFSISATIYSYNKYKDEYSDIE